jgi:dTMP kinase
MSRGKLIAIEGIDGAGTTTQCERLARRFGLHATREPSDRPIGKLLRQFLRGELGAADERAIALLFAADRIDHVTREIEGELAGGKSVISDRYVLSSLVYQSQMVAREFVVAINAAAPPADLTILVDVAADVARQRRHKRGGPDERYDDDDVQRRLAEAYRREIANVPNGVVVDGNGTPDEVFAALERVVQSCLGSGGGTSS